MSDLGSDIDREHSALLLVDFQPDFLPGVRCPLTGARRFSNRSPGWARTATVPQRASRASCASARWRMCSSRARDLTRRVDPSSDAGVRADPQRRGAGILDSASVSDLKNPPYTA